MTTQIHLMRSLYLKAVTVVLGMVPTALACITLATAVVPVNVARASNGQCKWEGGTNPPAYCEAEDCIGRGGQAPCSAGEPAVASGYSDSQVKPDKWLYSATDDFYNQTFTNPTWCFAAGGNWVGDANPYCTNLPGDVITERLANDEGRIAGIAVAFANGWYGGPNCNGAHEVSDTGWGVASSSSLGA
jgi:hypothetical protein